MRIHDIEVECLKAVNSEKQEIRSLNHQGFLCMLLFMILFPIRFLNEWGHLHQPILSGVYLYYIYLYDWLKPKVPLSKKNISKEETKTTRKAREQKAT